VVCHRPSPVASSITVFLKVTVDDIISALRRLRHRHTSNTSAELAADLIVPFLMELFNRSLLTATVTTVFKLALITPLIKKPDLDSADPRSYRPISNLSVVSKLLERIVFRQFYSYLSAKDLLPRLHTGHITLPRRTC